MLLFIISSIGKTFALVEESDDEEVHRATH
jgi:hypothetical protein